MIEPKHDAPSCAKPDCGFPMNPALYAEYLRPGAIPETVGATRQHTLVCMGCGHERAATIREVSQAWYAIGAYEQSRRDEVTTQLHADLRALVHDYGLSAWIYDVRERAATSGDDYTGSSWEHPSVVQFGAICERLAERVGEKA